MKSFKARGYGGPVGPTWDRPIISSVQVEEGPSHDRVHVWNRGGKAGVLTVEKGDGEDIAKKLLIDGWVEDE